MMSIWITNTKNKYGKYEKFNKNVCYLNKKAFYNDEFMQGTISGLLSDIKQPSRKKVNKAIIWSISDDMSRLMYKSGGDCMSASQYTSSLSTLIDDNGKDKRIVVLKKYGKNLNQVKITSEEISEKLRELGNQSEKDLMEYRQVEIFLQITARIMENRSKFSYQDIQKGIDRLKGIYQEDFRRFINYSIRKHKKEYIRRNESKGRVNWNEARIKFLELTRIDK